MNKKEEILEKAIELFNEKGIEYGGMRELAGLMGMRVSNITYYFPTKDALVEAIIAELQKTNNEIFNSANTTTLSDFMEMYRRVFLNQYQYRCLLLSFVHIVTQNPAFSKNYGQVETKRKQQISGHLKTLIENGYLLKTITGEQIELITGGISLVSRFWISEARISNKKKPVAAIVDHYIRILAEFMYRYATAKGRRQLLELI